jgi:hypothetical protein
MHNKRNVFRKVKITSNMKQREYMNFIEIRIHVKSFMGNSPLLSFFSLQKWSWFYGKNAHHHRFSFLRFCYDARHFYYLSYLCLVS